MQDLFHLPNWQYCPLNPGGHLQGSRENSTGVPPLAHRVHFLESGSCDVCVTGGLHFVPLQQTTSES